MVQEPAHTPDTGEGCGAKRTAAGAAAGVAAQQCSAQARSQLRHKAQAAVTKAGARSSAWPMTPARLAAAAETAAGNAGVSCTPGLLLDVRTAPGSQTYFCKLQERVVHT
jgi:hypothetical protein